MMQPMKSVFAICFFSVCIGCSMERVPVSVQKTVPLPRYDFAPCEFHAFPVKNTSLLPSIRCIDCEVEHELAPETVEFEFTHNNGEIFGKQTRKRIDEVNLDTNELGVIYYLNYAPENGVQDSLGRWCCWNLDSEVPTYEQMLPDELNAVHIVSDGGIVYRASWNIGKQPRGLAMLLCGLGGMQHSSKTLGSELLQEGWAVVYVYTVLNVPEYRMKVKLKGANPIGTAIEIFDAKYCHVIAATKAIRSRMEQQLPRLRTAPLALIGISAGALNTPAVYRELQSEVDAVILVAGGANMFDIVQDGAFTNWKFTDYEGNTFTHTELQQMNNSFLNTPSRDAYFLAPELPREHTLIIHAKWDAVVPAENGDLLWERAGHPERWVYPSGHLGLFMTFGWHSPDIARWLNTHTNNQP